MGVISPDFQFESDGPRRSQHRRKSLPSVLDTLREDATGQDVAPDLTKRIMGRLGYMRAHRRVIRRQFARRLMRRAGLVGVTLVVVLIGVQVFRVSDAARTPGRDGASGLSIPAALNEDIALQRARFERLHESLRCIVRPVRVEDAVGGAGSNRPGGWTVQPGDTDNSTERIAPQWLAVGPVRWM